MIHRNLPILGVPGFLNLPIIYRFSRGIYRFLSISQTGDPSTIHRANRQKQGLESSANRQIKPCNRQIAPFLDRPSGPRNHQVIINRLAVIVNPAALNPSRIYQSRAPIHQFASESFTFRSQIRNRPAKPAGENIRNYPQPAWPGSANAAIYQLGWQPIVPILESSDNHPINLGNHPTQSLNRPIIDRRNRGIDRVPAKWRVPNLP